MMKKLTYCLIGMLMILCACEKDENSGPKLDDEMIGFWFKLTSEERIAIDVDGYFWGVQIEENGGVTTARLDYYNSAINTEASGAMFNLTKAENGSFTGKTTDLETISGTYSIGEVSNAGYDYSLLTLNSSQMMGYLPGGTGGDWSITGKYIKLYNLDGSDASLGESPITSPPAAPTGLVFNRELNGGAVTLEWVDNATTESNFEIERREYETGDYVKIATLDVDKTSYIDNTVTADKVYQYRVKAVNSIGGSDYSNVIVVKGIPKTPWSLTAHYNTRTYTAYFTWWARYSDDITHFQFALWDGASYNDLSFTFSSEPSEVVNDQWQESGTMNYNNGLAWPPGTYKFKVKAVNSEGESGYSEPVEMIVEGKKSIPEHFDYLRLFNN